MSHILHRAKKTPADWLISLRVRRGTAMRTSACARRRISSLLVRAEPVVLDFIQALTPGPKNKTERRVHKSGPGLR